MDRANFTIWCFVNVQHLYNIIYTYFYMDAQLITVAARELVQGSSAAHSWDESIGSQWFVERRGAACKVDVEMLCFAIDGLRKGSRPAGRPRSHAIIVDTEVNTVVCTYLERALKKRG